MRYSFVLQDGSFYAELRRLAAWVNMEPSCERVEVSLSNVKGFVDSIILVECSVHDLSKASDRRNSNGEVPYQGRSTAPAQSLPTEHGLAMLIQHC